MKVRVADRGRDFHGKRWRTVWTDPETRRERSRSFAKKIDAEEYRTKLEHDLRSGVYLDPAHSNISFGEVAQEFLATKHGLKASSRGKYERTLFTWVLPRWGATPIGHIRRADVETWAANLLAGAAPHQYADGAALRRPQTLAPATARAVLGRFTSVLEFAVRHEYVASNRARGIELPSNRSGRMVFLAHADVEHLAESAEAHGSRTDGTLVLWMSYTGARIGEALALTVGDLDLARRRAVIRQTWTEDSGRMVLGAPKTGKSRTVPVHGFLISDLASLVIGQPDNAYVFRAPRGGPISAHNWRSRVWPKALASAGLAERGLTPHALRHTAASMAIAAGADVLVVQNMLGHANATETLNRYGHLWPDRLDEVTEAMGRARAEALDRAESGRIRGHTDSFLTDAGEAV